MFQQQGRSRSCAVANPSLLEAAVKEKKMALVREANRAVEAAPVPPASRDRNREERFLLPAWATEDPPRESHFRLKVHEGGNLVEVLQMGEKVAYLLGRHKAAGCDCLLEHQTVSRKHAAVVHHQDGSVRLLDLGSSHGTWLDGTRLQPHRGSAALQDGSRLQFGQCEQTCTGS